MTIGIACWRKNLTFEAFGGGDDVKDQGQDAETYTDRRNVVITVLCGHTLAVHALAQRFPLIRNTLLGWGMNQLRLQRKTFTAYPGL